MTYNIETLSELTGLTPRQLYDRIEALESQLDGHVITGQRGKKILDDYAFQVLQRLITLEKEGLSREAAVKVIVDELKNRGREEGEGKASARSGNLTET